MNIPHDKFCVLPWISLEASPIGTVRPCCLADHEITDDRGTKFLLGIDSFDDIRNSNHMTQLRTQFLAGKQPDTCRRCWAEESAGRTSKRMHTLDRLKHLPGLDQFTEQVKPLMFVDFKLGNICNLKCRICGSWSSSTYAVEEITHATGNPKQTFAYQMLKQGRWPREQQEFWKELEQHSDQLNYLEFTGGEPFMIEEHFDLLRELIQRGLSSQIEIHYNTNGTQYPEGAEEIWKKFKHVEIAFSIDDVGARFEYQRSGAQWNNVVSNIKLFRDMKARCGNITLQVCCTVNVFNVLYLADVAQWIEQQHFDFVYWNMLHDAPQHCIADLPQPVKHSIATCLDSAQIPDLYKKDIKGVVDFMFSRQGNNGQALLDNIRMLDQRRGENLQTVAPELAKILNYE
jgi:MoaA/NifB/PqqE/SkfB family radical SAM enzyme